MVPRVVLTGPVSTGDDLRPVCFMDNMCPLVKCGAHSNSASPHWVSVLARDFSDVILRTGMAGWVKNLHFLIVDTGELKVTFDS